MSRKRKTPKELARVIMERYVAMIEMTEERIRVKREVPVENQADHIRNTTEAEMVARMEGYSSCLEDTMHEFNCYGGFHNYGPKVQHVEDGKIVYSGRHSVSEKDADYLPWRKLYYTRGIAK